MKRLLLVVIMATLLTSVPAYGQSEEVVLPLYTILDESHGILLWGPFAAVGESGVVHNCMTLLNLGRRNCSVVLDYVMFDDSGKSIYETEIRIKDLRRNTPKQIDYQLKVENARGRGACVVLDIKEVDEQRPSLGSSGGAYVKPGDPIYLPMYVPLDRENDIYVGTPTITVKGPVVGRSNTVNVESLALIWVRPRSRPMTVSFMVDLYAKSFSQPAWFCVGVKTFSDLHGWTQWLEQLEECPAASYQCGILRIASIAK